jgi:hypothetical protein
MSLMMHKHLDAVIVLHECITGVISISAHDGRWCGIDTPASASSHSCSPPPPGMYLGSAAAMLVLPSISAAFGAASLLKVVGGLGLVWLVLWVALGQEIPHR